MIDPALQEEKASRTIVKVDGRLPPTLFLRQTHFIRYQLQKQKGGIGRHSGTRPGIPAHFSNAVNPERAVSMIRSSPTAAVKSSIIWEVPATWTM